jgi:DNA-binding NarL/FixJ family response regulator
LCTKLGSTTNWAMVVIDTHLLDLSGVASVLQLRQQFPLCRVALMSDYPDRESIIAAIAAGAHGYVPKNIPAEEMANAFKLILDGHVYVPDYLADVSGFAQNNSADIPQIAAFSLTPRQQDVLEQLHRGLSNKEIANALAISESTVKVHLVSIFRILGVHNRIGAIAGLRNSDSQNAL